MGYPIIRLGNELYSVFIIYESCILAYLCLVIKLVLLCVPSFVHLSDGCLLVAPCLGTRGVGRRSRLLLSDAYSFSGEADIKDLIAAGRYLVIGLAWPMGR